MSPRKLPVVVSSERLRALPKLPGVYLMKDKRGSVLYVGKAKNLKARIRSYFSKGDSRQSIPYLLAQVQSVETLVTQDERQAILLESDLIKKYKPHYNVRLKDDKAYLLVRLDLNQDWPRLELVRAAREDGARYFGPYAFSYELRTLLEVIKRTVPLRTCTDHMLHNRVRPCLEHQIKRCAGPCCLDVDRVQYLAWIEQAVSILRGRTGDVAKELAADMERASAELRFEDAAVIRDRLQVLRQIEHDKTQRQFNFGASDAWGLYREGDKVELCVLMVRQGRLFEAKTFGFPDAEGDNQDILGSLLSQFYSKQGAQPELILLPFALEDSKVREDILTERAGEKVTIAVPQRGDKARLVGLAQRNAKENFEARFSALDKSARVLGALQKEFRLAQMPRTMECVDISHFQGAATVGSVVAFADAKPDKARYRHFHLSQEGKPDDFASMREILTRHLSRSAEENTLADLLVVDGGPAQLAQALGVRRELGLDGPVMIGLAKKRTMRKIRPASPEAAVILGKKPERIFVEGRALPVVLRPDSEVLQLLERIRNEAHRFAVSFHRSVRAKKVFRSALDSIPGLGPVRRMTLLREFKSIDGIRRAEPEEISRRCRVPLALAKRIVQLLRRS
ncbi:MAG TPA: excinuclease ABC subunit UvrC [Oligoflexia bacterium]|nr:excinuclease ABC subunit UvrC [Oligoflexia bacterium]